MHIICYSINDKNSKRTKRTNQSTYIDALDTGQHWTETSLKYMFINITDTSGGEVEDGYDENLRDWISIQKDNMKIAITNW